ncbi:hypothetical protein Tco_0224937, partial [Tanacetum coccineum]
VGFDFLPWSRVKSLDLPTFPYLLPEESDTHQKTVGVEIGRNRKNENKNTLGSSVDIDNQSVDPRNKHKQDIVVEEFVNHVVYYPHRYDKNNPKSVEVWYKD